MSIRGGRSEGQVLPGNRPFGSFAKRARASARRRFASPVRPAMATMRADHHLWRMESNIAARPDAAINFTDRWREPTGSNSRSLVHGRPAP
jgi:hypothetical protein